MDERFWSRVDRRGPDECWEYTGAGYGPPDRDGKRYGQVKRKGRVVAAHRLAYSDAVGPIPAGAYLMHSCDNPPCCNPAHLSVGTNRDNQLDAVAKGRARMTRGEASPVCKFSDATIALVRSLREAGWSQRRIAQALGISATYAGQIGRGERRAAT